MKVLSALSSIPIFPLPEVVLFPGGQLPLHVFEMRYRKMLEDCIGTHGALVLAMIDEGQTKEGLPRIRSIAGGGMVLQRQVLADGRSNILVRGEARLFLEELPFEAPYRRARATVLFDQESSVKPSDGVALSVLAKEFLQLVRKENEAFSPPLDLSARPSALADQVAQYLLVDAGCRQRVLEELCPRERVAMVTHALSEQLLWLSRKTEKVQGSIAN